MPVPVIPAVTDALSAYLAPRWNRVVVEVGMQIEDLWKYFFNFDPDMPWSPLEESQVSGLGVMRSKPQGQGFAYDSIIPGGSVTYRSNPWGLGFEWTLEMMRFDLFGLFDDVSTDLMRSGPHRVELEAWALLNDAFTGALYTGFDGLQLCSTAHPYIDTTLGTFSNRSATDVAFSQTGIQEMLLHYDTLNDMRGLPNQRKPSLLLINPNRKFSAREILGSEYDPLSANNTLNSITDDALRYASIRYLTSTSAWFATTMPNMGNRGHDAWVRFTIPLTPDQFDDRRTRSAVHTLYQNFAVGFGSPFGVWGSAGTGV